MKEWWYQPQYMARKRDHYVVGRSQKWRRLKICALEMGRSEKFPNLKVMWFYVECGSSSKNSGEKCFKMIWACGKNGRR